MDRGADIFREVRERGGYRHETWRRSPSGIDPERTYAQDSQRDEIGQGLAYDQSNAQMDSRSREQQAVPCHCTSRRVAR
jgi:hypothetical protein